MLISLEGLEGSGKSTQQQLLIAYLESRGFCAQGFQEPGGTVLGDEIRKLLLDPASVMGPMSELFLFAAARRQLVNEKLIPCKRAGQTVVLDRYYDSTTAYQCYGRGLDSALVDEVNHKVVGENIPDLTIIFDLDPQVGLKRSQKQHKPQAGKGELDRIEAAGLDFLTRIRQGFLAIAENEPERCKVILVDCDVEAIARQVQELVQPLLPVLH
jgi:dTMP kinase